MEIKNINNTPSFTGIYKLRNVDFKTVKQIKEYMPFFADVTNLPVYMFSGRHPMEGSVVSIINSSVKECKQYSYDWLVQNAQNHGLLLPNIRSVEAWVLTGKDVKIFQQFMENANKTINKSTSFFAKLKILFFGSPTPNPSLPRYLRGIVPLLNENDKLIDIYAQTLHGSKVVEVENLEKLIYSMCRDA